MVIASASQSLAAAADRARKAGVMPLVIGDEVEGEAREVGAAMATTALSAAGRRRPGDPPLVLLSGGETTVTVEGHGKGGRNGEFLAGLALTLGGAPGIFALAADTDGIDGTEDNAGAFVTPDTVARASAAGLDLGRHLLRNDVYPVFAALGDLLVTGPTRTNVNDFRAILIR
jgi:glycerate 2-kinase